MLDHKYIKGLFLPNGHQLLVLHLLPTLRGDTGFLPSPLLVWRLVTLWRARSLSSMTMKYQAPSYLFHDLEEALGRITDT